MFIVEGKPREKAGSVKIIKRTTRGARQLTIFGKGDFPLSPFTVRTVPTLRKIFPSLFVADSLDSRSRKYAFHFIGRRIGPQMSRKNLPRLRFCERLCENAE